MSLAWRRGKAHWVRRGGMAAADRSGVECEDRPSCPCPTCQTYGAMRDRARIFHDSEGMSWVDAWRAAGWGGDGGAETPFCNPGETISGKSPTPAAARPKNWMVDRFAELFTTSDESNCNGFEGIPSLRSPKLEVPT